MGKIPKKKSKRLLVKDKNKIAKKVRQHHQKQRKEAKKNPNKFKHKDPGIPNSWPFKQELLAEIEAGREEERAMHQRARAHKEMLKQKAINQRAAKAAKAAPSAKQLRDASATSALSSAHVLLLCVDARDPPASRCAKLEQLFVQGPAGHSALVVLLNHAHLVPADNLTAWLKALRADGVAAVPFSATANEAAAPRAAASSRQRALHAVGVTELCELLGRLASAEGLVPRGPKEQLQVVVAGAPGSGAAEVLRCVQLRLKKKGPARGLVAALGVPVSLEPRLGDGSLPEGNPTAGLLTFGLRPSRKATDLEQLAAALLARCVDSAAVMRHYSLPSFGSAADFLRHLAAALELPAAEATGEPDPALAALAFLEQWRLGRVPFCARAPPAEKAGVGKKAGGAAGAGSAGAAAVALVRQVYTEQVNGELVAAFAQAAAKDGATAEGAHLVLEPSAAGLQSELVSKLEQIAERKAARRARGGARASAAVGAEDEGGADGEDSAVGDAMEE